MRWTFGLWIDERFNDISFPKLPALGTGIFAFVGIQVLIMAPKRQIQVFCGPPAGDYGFSFREHSPGERSLIKANALCSRPHLLPKVAIRYNINLRKL